MRFAALFLVGVAALAQETTPVTLDEAVRVAMERNPGIAIARKRVAEADTRIRQAKSGYYPELSFSGIAKVGLSGGTNALGLVGLPNSPFFRNFAVALNAYQPVYDSGRTKFRLAYEKRRKEVLEADIEADEARVTIQTVRAYYELLRAEKTREVAAATLKSGELTVRQANAFFEAGLRSRVDLDLAEVNSSRARLQVLESNSRISLATAGLARSMGAPQTLRYTPAEPPFTKPAPEPLEDLIQEAIESRPEMRALKAEQASTREQINMARAEGKPLIALVFSGGFARFSDYLARNLLSSGVGAIWPLFAGGRYKAQVQEAQAHLATLESVEEDFQQGIALEVRKARVQLRNTMDSLSTLRLRAESARRAVRVARERYHQRLGTLVELNEAEVRLSEAATRESTGLYDVAEAEAELRFAVGQR